MIHSMAGGKIGGVSYNDFAKVKICEGANAGDIFWYLTGGLNIKAGSIVVVPVGAAGQLTKAEVLRVDKNVSSQVSPVPVRRAKSIARVVTY